MQQPVIEGFRLSPQQKRLWLLQQADPAFPLRAVCAVLIEGNIDERILQAALSRVVDRHEILRTSFCCLPGTNMPLQVINPTGTLTLHEYDLSDCNPEEQEARLEILFREKGRLQFDFEKPPLLDVSLVSLSPSRCVLLIALPALCADNATLPNLVREVCRCYEACLKGEEIPDAPTQYVEFSEWQKESQAAAEDKTAACSHTLDWAALGALKLPSENGSAGARAFKPDAFHFTINGDRTARIKSLVENYGISTGTLLFACWATLLWRLTGQTNIIIGLRHDGRKHEELREALGLFSKYLPLDCHLTESLTFDDVLWQVDKHLHQVDDWHESFSWEKISDSATGGPQRSFFPFIFELDEMPERCAAVGLVVSIYKQDACTERFKVKFSCIPKGSSITAALYFDANLYQSGDIERLARQFQTLLESVTHGPHGAIADLEILSEDDRRQVLCEFNRATTEYPTNKCIHQLFEEQALRLPDRGALVFESERLTYGELNARANQLAHHLRAFGVRPDTPVAICVNRSLDMIVGILGILKAGGAWLPMDPGYPKERLEFMFKDARVQMLLTESGLAEKLPQPGTRTVLLDADRSVISRQSQDNPTTVSIPTNMAYVIYTSGSTGQPKGVMVPHSSLCQYVQALGKPLGIAAEDVYLHIASIAFSSSVRQLMVPLTHGSKVVIASIDRIRQPVDLFRMIKSEGVTIIDIVPSYWRSCIGALYNLELTAREMLLENCLRLIVTASEPLLYDLPRRWAFEFKHPAKLINMFGQTETTGIVAVYPTSPVDHQEAKIVHIGRPISNAKIYLLNARQQPVPVGVLGEICVAGGGLSRGYLNQPGLTAERFVPNPFTDEPGARLYKTGDLGRHLPDGNIEFVGRTDQQVKIRGFRVEVSEIESVLNRYDGVRQAVVIAQEDVPGEKRLIAYVVADGLGAAATTDLRRFISEKLPDYMVPAVFIFLDALPLTPNGKVDRMALPAPDQGMRNLEAVFVAPRTVVEDALAQIWSEVLGLEQVGVHDNFFDLGGHSLLAMQIISKVFETLQVELPVRSFFEVSTVAGLAKLIETIRSMRQGQQRSIESREDREEGEL